MADNADGILQRGYKFWRRHRQKALLVGAVSGGVYAYQNSETVRETVNQGWSWLLQKLPAPLRLLAEDPDAFFEESGSKVHSHRRVEPGPDEDTSIPIADSQSVVATCSHLLQSAFKILDEVLDIESLRHRIAKSPPNKMDLWEEMKIVAWTRCIVSLYTTCHLMVYIKIQTGVAGRFLCSQDSTSGHLLQRKLQIISAHMQCAEFVVTDGFRRLINASRRAVEKSVGHRSLQEFLSLSDIKVLGSEIRQSIESPAFYAPSYHMDFCIPPEQLENGNEREPVICSDDDQAMVELTREVNAALESVDCALILRCCLELCFTVFFREMDLLMRDKTDAGRDAPSVRLPHAALIPAISRMVNLFMAPTECEPVLRDLASIQYFQVFVDRITKQTLQRDCLTSS